MEAEVSRASRMLTFSRQDGDGERLSVLREMSSMSSSALRQDSRAFFTASGS